MSGSDRRPGTVTKIRMRWWWLVVLLVPASVAFGQAHDAVPAGVSRAESALSDVLADEAERRETVVSGDGSFAEFVEEAEYGSAMPDGAGRGEDGFSHSRASAESRVKVGMSLEEALEVLGTTPDSQSEIGAACGKFDVLTWDEDGTRLISVDGKISSVYEGRKKPQE
ncbi:MAG: hypothetical protein PVH25_08525 [Burkholderiales bacterium]